MNTLSTTAALICVAILTSMFCPPVQASSVENVTIVRVHLTKDFENVAFIKLSSPPQGKPGCSAHYWDFTLPLNTPFEKNLFAMLMTAYSTGTLVQAGGVGACNDHPQIESLTALAVHN
jgi:hypothetical protein